MLNRHRKLRMEQMEARQMMAGDVFAFMQNGNLILNEATGQSGLDNSVAIQRISDTVVRVIGKPTLTDGTVSKINGNPSADFTINPNTSLTVNFGGGSDAFTFAPVGGEVKFKEIHINVAAPSQTITRTDVRPTASLPVFPRPDNDTVFLERFSTKGAVSINTGVGTDSVNILNARIGTSGATPANVSINTGAGADFVRVRSSVENTLITGTLDVQTFSSALEADTDTVIFDTFGVKGDVHVRTGGGKDTISMTTVGVDHKLDFDAGGDVDTATLNGVSALDSIMAKLGEGDDTLITSDLFTNNLTLDGGGGFDQLTKKADPHFSGKRTQTGWELINGLPAYMDDPVILNV
jgi:hypothetical protein